ncbi:MAG TPA: single-stranded-DNA-specific exonuclease RecJ [Woeseiaceae bacterium]|nr:single-stranded-DNA-specific exonuclease RecJ [Woeseiaceae bacterium]
MSVAPPRAARPVRRRAAPDASTGAALAGVDPVLAALYAARGITDAAQLDYSLQQLAPVGTLSGLREAVELLLAHRQRRIVVIGDFDADGATSTALVLRCLRGFAFADVDYRVPNRFDYGYGLTPEIVRVAHASGPSLLLTVDNGISSIEGVAEAHRLGMAVLITDHHLPGRQVPDADAIVNPHVRASTGAAAAASFASPHLAGVGVAFYLMAALGRALQERGREDAAKVPARYLDLVALGTVADVVSLDHNNRILVAQGLARIRSGRSVPGIGALLRCAGRDPARAGSADLGFAAAPRLNAAGRLDDMAAGIECLLTDDPAEAARMAAELDGINSARREIEEGMRREAFAFVDAMSARALPDCVCVFEPSWHQGIVGLVAARVRERCHRPAIAFAREQPGVLKGSARSVPGVHIRDLLEAVSTAVPGLVAKFGGHAMAAGLSLAEERLEAFSRAVCEQLPRLYPKADFSGAIVTDGPLPAASLNLPFARALRAAGPWGAGFPEPLWSGDFELVEQRTVGESHLKLRVRPADGGPTLDAIAFHRAGTAWRGKLRLVFRLDVNEWRGTETPQLVVEQITAL